MKQLCIMLLLMVSASAATISIYGTGVDQNNQSLTTGSVDPYWTLASVTSPATGLTGPQTYVPTGASVNEQVSNKVPAGWPENVWVGDLPYEWIAPQADVTALTDFDPNGVGVFYTYQETFSLTGLNPSTAQLSGYFAADNYVYSYTINGDTTVINAPDNASCGSGPFAFQSLSPFSITSGFTSGTNTLSFTVVNSDCYDQQGNTNPTGLLVDVSGTAGIEEKLHFNAPEPGTLDMALTGLGLMLVWATRKRVK